MAVPENELSERSGHLVEEHKGYDPRVLFFYILVGGLLMILAGGLAFQQLIKSPMYHERERQQNERRIILPAPRGNIYDRDGRLLVGNWPRYAAVLHLDELQQEFRREFIRIRNNYRRTGDLDVPTATQMEQIAEVSVVQRYLDQIDAILGRGDRVDVASLRRHFASRLLLPYTLLPNLSPEQFARLIEHLPIGSPLQVEASIMRTYPHGSLASHVLGYVGITDDVDAANLPESDLTTFRMKGSAGRDGLEKTFDARLQGRPGSLIVEVDPSGFEVNRPEKIYPVPGKDLVTSLDIDLQEAAEQALGDQTGAAVALDVRTGEVLALASKPDYDLNKFSPRLSKADAADIEQRKAWMNLAISGLYPPGSTFKTIVSVAGLRSGRIDPDKIAADCEGEMRIGNRIFRCDNGNGHHGELSLVPAIAESCDIYFWTEGLAIGAERIAAEARRLGLDRPTGIELPGESHAMIVPDAAWKRKNRDEAWTDGDTANMSIGQGFLRFTPLQMACWAASLARGETTTVPTLVHDPNRPEQHTEPLGLTPAQREAIVRGMVACTDTTYPHDTAYFLATASGMALPGGVRIAGKTGTAQVSALHTDIAWFICFAPADDPKVAVAVTVQGALGNTDFSGAFHSAPIADMILQAYFRKHPAAGTLSPSRGSPASAQTAYSPAPGSPSPGL